MPLAVESSVMVTSTGWVPLLSASVMVAVSKTSVVLVSSMVCVGEAPAVMTGASFTGLMASVQVFVLE